MAMKSNIFYHPNTDLVIELHPAPQLDQGNIIVGAAVLVARVDVHVTYFYVLLKYELIKVQTGVDTVYRI